MSSRWPESACVMQLTEKHRPVHLAEVIGQDATVQSLRLMLSRGLSSKAFYFLGASGTGKDSLAQALCNELAIDDLSISFVAGADCNAEYVRTLEEDFNNSSLFSVGDGWKACIVSEAHSMSRQAVQLLLPFLERLPKNRLVIFTSNAGLEAYAEFSGALFSRCAVFHLDINEESAAVHASKIAESEGLNGRPIQEYRNLIRACDGNLRAALQQIQQGRMLRPFEASKPIAVSKQHAVQREKHVEPIKAPKVKRIASGSLQERIDNEIAFGAKFFAGSKKYTLHIARLTALKAEATNG